ncbi:hypothetical protein TSUD_91350 [Trifolium subterraneum]|uniref:RING-type domain-containing protein n=1 Tax=Trifolium subterraneum TaxID=3900 RepID=A0A2Z6P4G7_TRISU|nr:hypothetical protein TSUD_91350 [Trifolium subterraneum]
MSSRTGRITPVRGYTRRRKVGLDLDLNLPAGEHPFAENPAEEQTRISNSNRYKRRREPPNQTIINCDLYINLEGSSSSTMETVKKPPEPPKEPVFSCPICMGPLVEEMSTRCGHIFCKACIKAAISAQAKCPTCRKKITVKELIRVFLPTTG